MFDFYTIRRHIGCTKIATEMYRIRNVKRKDCCTQRMWGEMRVFTTRKKIKARLENREPLDSRSLKMKNAVFSINGCEYNVLIIRIFSYLLRKQFFLTVHIVAVATVTACRLELRSSWCRI